MNNTKRARTQLRNTEETLRRHEEAARRQMEARMFEIGIMGGQHAVLEQVKTLQTFRKQTENQPGMQHFVNLLDWGIECCWHQHPSYSNALDRFIQETCG